MFSNRNKEIAKKPRYMATSVSVGLALGVIFAMLFGADGTLLPVGIGAGIAVGAAVGAILLRRSQKS